MLVRANLGVEVDLGAGVSLGVEVGLRARVGFGFGEFGVAETSTLRASLP